MTVANWMLPLLEVVVTSFGSTFRLLFAFAIVGTYLREHCSGVTALTFPSKNLNRGRNLPVTFPTSIMSQLNDKTDVPLTVSSIRAENPELEFSSDDSTFKTHLIVHFDINETILLGDQAGGDSLLDSWHKMFAKSAFCKIPDIDSGNEQGSTSWEETQNLRPTHWWDGQEIGSETTTPPLYTGWEWPDRCCPYYRTAYKEISKNFVDHHGKVYRELFDKCQQVRKHSQASAMPSGSHILPALYHTLHHLITNEQIQPFSVVFRTFGDDLPDVAEAVTAFAEGKHPEYPDVKYPSFSISRDCLFQGRWKQLPDKGEMVYQLWDLDETNVIASGDYEILHLLEQHRMCGICDDYPTWAANKWHPTTGKPVWVPRRVQNPTTQLFDHHILFDDNIHNLHHDGIACIRQQTEIDHSFVTLDCQRMHQLQGIHLVRVPTIEPVLNDNWFVMQIAKARSRLVRRLLDEGQTPATK